MFDLFSRDYSTSICQIFRIRNSISNRITPSTCASRHRTRWGPQWTAPPTWALNVSMTCQTIRHSPTNSSFHPLPQTHRMTSASRRTLSMCRSIIYRDVSYANRRLIQVKQINSTLSATAIGYITWVSLLTLSEPSYEWLYPNKTVTMGNTLIINDPIKRNDTGIYRCRARNKHGDRIAETVIDVQCK